jgi:hypothetical protein
VKELAEVLAVDFDVADGIPKLKTTWRWEDEEQALLSSCSSLIAIVNVDHDDNDTSRDSSDDDTDTSRDSSDDDRRVVQFSHFSVKGFLTSPRLATPSRDVSYYHILLEPAHTIMAQACLSILLRSDDSVDQSSVAKASPLGRYAAEYWVTHAQFESVSYLHYVLRYSLRLHWVQNTASTGMSVAREVHGPKATRGDGDEGSRATATRRAR